MVKVELTHLEMHDILSCLYYARYGYQEQLREHENSICDEDDKEMAETIDSLKCRIDDLKCLEDKLRKAKIKDIEKVLK